MNEPQTTTKPARPVLVRFRMRITVLVPAALLVVAWFWGRHPLPLPWLLGGTACVLLGAALRLWAAGCLRKQEAVVCWGPFAHMRNPLYAGTLLIGCGLALLTGRWESLALVAAVMLAVYLPTVLHEERELRALFGPAYDDYCRAVPRWLPHLTPLRVDGARPSWTQIRHNREHRHLIAQLLCLAAFYAIDLLKR
ncbi:MAG: methyltransferase family protein [Armatimonadota bacterium]